MEKKKIILFVNLIPFIPVENPCKKNPCHSTALCVLSQEGRTCMCPLEMTHSPVDSMLDVSDLI